MPAYSLQPIIMMENHLQMRDEIGLTKKELRDIPEQNSGQTKPLTASRFLTTG